MAALREPALATVADTNGGRLSRTNTLTPKGSFNLANDDFDGTFFIGYFKTDDAANNFVGIEIAEPSTRMSRSMPGGRCPTVFRRR